MFQQTEFNFYGESFKFIVMSEVKSVHNENEVSNTMKEVFALESRHLIDTFMAESFLHLIKFRETGAMSFLLCQNTNMLKKIRQQSTFFKSCLYKFPRTLHDAFPSN